MARRDHDGRRAEIVAAVRELCAETSVDRLSIAAVTERVGVARSLFYHYFPDKESAVEAALDQVIEESLARIRAWNDARTPGDVEGALNSCAALFRELVLEGDALPASLMFSDNSALYTAYVHRIADRMASYMRDNTARDFAAVHGMPIDHVYETFYVLIVGLVMYIRMNPDAPVETIRDVAAATLHIEGYLNAVDKLAEPKTPVDD